MAEEKDLEERLRKLKESHDLALAELEGNISENEKELDRLYHKKEEMDASQNLRYVSLLLCSAITAENNARVKQALYILEKLMSAKELTSEEKIRMAEYTAVAHRLYYESSEKSRKRTCKRFSRRKAGLNDIVSAFEAVVKDDESSISDLYEAGSRLITDQETLHKFIPLIPGYKKGGIEHDISVYCGAFLSGIINNLEDEEIVLDLRNFNHTKNYLGERFAGRLLIIKGDVHGDLGSSMQSGKIVVEGGATSNIGGFMYGGEIIIKGNVCYELGSHMSSGKILVEGNAKNEVGCNMKGGIIIVQGNAGEHIGKEMEGGEIHINGEYESLSNRIKGGEIYHKGRRVFP